MVGASGRIRTCDTWYRKPVLYPLSYGGMLSARWTGLRSALTLQPGEGGAESGTTTRSGRGPTCRSSGRGYGCGASGRPPIGLAGDS